MNESVNLCAFGSGNSGLSIYRLYREEELIVRTKLRRKIAREQRADARYGRASEPALEHGIRER